MFKSYTERMAIKYAFLVLLFLLACHFTMSLAIAPLAIWGVWCAFNKRIACAWGVYFLLAMLTVTSEAIVPKGIYFAVIERLGFFALSLSIAYSGRVSKPMFRDIPLGMLMPFLLFAALFSFWGFAPIVSELKIIQFLVFLLSIWFGLRGFEGKPEEAQKVRAMILGVIVVYIFGSLISTRIPRIGYMTSVRWEYAMLGEREALAALEAKIRSGEDLMLFCGITNQSQVIGSVFPCFIAWLGIDMLALERRFSGLHTLTILTALPLIYLSRSRTGIFASGVAVVVLVFYWMPKIGLNRRIRQNLAQVLMLAGVVLVSLCVVFEMKESTITRWMRKTENVEMDSRTLSEAVTESRQGLISETMYEFRRSPFVGSGFQVSEKTKDLVDRSKGLIFTAPIEKGLTPLMVLGETGILGEIAFVIFLVSFWAGCNRRRLFVTSGLFTVMFATNIGEASFFAPGGAGGVLWILCVGGGFICDVSLLQRGSIQAVDDWTRSYCI